MKKRWVTIAFTLFVPIFLLFLYSPNVHAVSAADSKTELKTAVTTPMTMENYQNIENNLLSAAKYNDITNPDKYANKRFNSRLKNVMRLRKTAKKTYKHEKKFLTKGDRQIFKNYTSSLRNYLYALHDYAVTYQEDVPVINDQNTESDTKNDAQTELNQAKDTFDSSKTAWTNAYNSIVNQ
ncbi:MAG: hypothetical protein ABF624_01505 [Liquorilactobacillus ghanensis]|uniref:hypothetical protein n=1 Tax=Liquorilactobacillus ghanensis TaxID=399370 RepID=UPI0039E8CC71